MPKSTATGRFAHDGANEEKLEDGDSVGQSDRDSMYGPDVNQGPSFAFFPPSVIAPFMALLQTGMAAISTETPNMASSSSCVPAAPGPPSSSSVAAISTGTPFIFSNTVNTASSSVRTAPGPPSSSSAPLFQSSSIIPPSLSSIPMSQSSPTMHLPSSLLPHAVASSSAMHLTPSTSSPSISSISTRSKRKQSAITDPDDQGSLKRRGPRISSGNTASAGEAAILHGFQGSMNHFSDVVHLNNETQPHTILKDATSKLNGAWGTMDKFTDGQKIVLLKLFRQNHGIASLYASTENSRVRRGYVLSELEPHQAEVDSYDNDEI